MFDDHGAIWFPEHWEFTKWLRTGVKQLVSYMVCGVSCFLILEFKICLPDA
jgi:hypothetical protein